MHVSWQPVVSCQWCNLFIFLSMSSTCHLQQAASATSISTPFHPLMDVPISNTKSTQHWRVTIPVPSAPLPTTAQFQRHHNSLSFAEAPTTMGSPMQQRWATWNPASLNKINRLLVWFMVYIPMALGLASICRWRVSQKQEKHLLVEVHLLGLVGKEEMNEASSMLTTTLLLI